MKKIYISLMLVAIASVAFGQESPMRSVVATSATFLPAESFSAALTNHGVAFKWTSINENNSVRHEIEKSANGSSFQTVGVLPAQNDPQTHHYSYSDATPVEGLNYYRLKTVDRQGNITYSRIVNVDNSFRRPEVRVISNPVNNGVLNIQMQNLDAGKYNIALFNSGGVRVLARSFNHSAGSATETIYLPRQLGRGLYILQVTDGAAVFNQQIVLQ